MRIAVFSDIHSNSWAFKAVLDDIHQYFKDISELWVLGDLLGRGPDPAASIRLLQDQDGHTRWITGNHEDILARIFNLENYCDQGAGKDQERRIDLDGRSLVDNLTILKRVSGEGTDESALLAMLLNRKAMVGRPEEAWLRERWSTQEHRGPQTITRDGRRLVMVHGTLRDPQEGYGFPWDDRDFYYKRAMVDPALEMMAQDRLPVTVCFGHTHIPLCMSGDAAGHLTDHDFDYGCPVPLTAPINLINPGSVGNPSDLDPRACWMVVDTNPARPAVTFYRTDYLSRRVGPGKQAFDQLIDKFASYPDKIREGFLTAQVREEKKAGDYLSIFMRRKTLPGGY
jgi:predicted phosphodiesterase